GTLSPTKALWFLPSDYEPRARTNEVPFSDVERYITDEVIGRSLKGVRVTFLINICGAGNAALGPGERAYSVDDERELIDASRRFFQENRFGQMQISIIPATPVGRNTFEDDTLKRSRFAFHLLNGLRGKAADREGRLTAGGLFDYIKSQSNEDIR